MPGQSAGFSPCFLVGAGFYTRDGRTAKPPAGRPQEKSPQKERRMKFDGLLAKRGCGQGFQRIAETLAASAPPPRHPSHGDLLTG